MSETRGKSCTDHHVGDINPSHSNVRSHNLGHGALPQVNMEISRGRDGDGRSRGHLETVQGRKKKEVGELVEVEGQKEGKGTSSRTASLDKKGEVVWRARYLPPKNIWWGSEPLRMLIRLSSLSWRDFASKSMRKMVKM